MKYAFLFACAVLAAPRYASSQSVQDFELDAAKATDVVTVLNEQFQTITFSAEPTTNTIYARVPASQAREVQQLIQRLEQAAENHLVQKRAEADRAVERAKAEAEAVRTKAEAARAESRKIAGARGDQPTTSKVNPYGITFEVPIGLRLARTHLRHAQLQYQKSLAIHGPDHPTVRSWALKVEALSHMDQQRINFLDLYTLGSKNESLDKPRMLGNIVKQLRPKLEIEFEVTGSGEVIFRGKKDVVEEAQRVMKALLQVMEGNDPKTLQQKYEDAERAAAVVASKLRQAVKSNANPALIADLRDHLRSHVQQAFSLRLQLQQAQLARAEADLATARARLIRREQLADTIINRRAEDLESGNDLSWLPKPSAASRNPSDPTNGSPESELSSGFPKTANEQNQTAQLRIGARDLESEGISQRWKAATGIELGEPVSKLKDSKHRGGLRIASVEKGSPAETAGIRKGDILLGISSWEILSLGNIKYVHTQLEREVDGKPVHFIIYRDDNSLTGELEVKDWAGVKNSSE